MKTLNQKTDNNKSTIASAPKKRWPRYVWLHIFPMDIWVSAKQGETIFDALRETDIKLNSECGGLGTCGKCIVKVLSVVDPPTQEEKALLDKEWLEDGIRLACRTHINRDLAISIGDELAKVEYYKVLTTSHVLPTRYIPISQLDPLVTKKIVNLNPDARNEGISYLDWIKQGLGPDYADLRASLHCLRSLPKKFKRPQTEGAAVLHDHFLLDWQKRNKSEHEYGLVFDLGTSTLVGKLIDLSDGSEVAVSSRFNSQGWHGADVISRLTYIQNRPDGLENLHDILLTDVNNIVRQLLKTAKLEPEDIYSVVAAGNTVMQHFLLNLSPIAIAEAPFSPVVTDGMMVNAIDVGLELNPSALLYVMPMKSGYIGGDLISFILNSGVIENKDGIILGLDLGTNGEVFLGNSKRLLSCSAAAGPAFEGAEISSGMIAKAGAIEGVVLKEGRLHYRTIGNIKPIGICGSGLVDLIAVLLHCGIIDYEGLIRPTPESGYKNINSRVIPQNGGYDFLVASDKESFHGRPIYLTQKSVRELQPAKGAIAAGIKILLNELGIGIEDISQVYLAGALGNYADRLSTLRIGLIPSINIERIKSLGNTASIGASMVLLSKKYWRMAEDVTKFVENIELSSRRDFNEYFVEQLNFPKENMW
jgi:uncharacterized 2Fe-2S/4Fe-4S cluster protein (DUF4445 family)